MVLITCAVVRFWQVRCRWRWQADGQAKFRINVKVRSRLLSAHHFEINHNLHPALKYTPKSSTPRTQVHPEVSFRKSSKVMLLRVVCCCHRSCCCAVCGLGCCEFATRCPVLGTERGDAATSPGRSPSQSLSTTWYYLLCSCYALSGTDVACGATSYAKSGTDVAYGATSHAPATRCPDVEFPAWMEMQVHTISSTNIAYSGTGHSVWRPYIHAILSAVIDIPGTSAALFSHHI
eukprot:3941456-Rhodomonas_salina.2